VQLADFLHRPQDQVQRHTQLQYLNNESDAASEQFHDYDEASSALRMEPRTQKSIVSENLLRLQSDTAFNQGKPPVGVTRNQTFVKKSLPLKSAGPSILDSSNLDINVEQDENFTQA